MMTATECLAHATAMDVQAAACHGEPRASFIRLAAGWRRVALLAAFQDNFTLQEASR